MSPRCQDTQVTLVSKVVTPNSKVKCSICKLHGGSTAAVQAVQSVAVQEQGNRNAAQSIIPQPILDVLGTLNMVPPHSISNIPPAGVLQGRIPAHVRGSSRFSWSQRLSVMNGSGATTYLDPRIQCPQRKNSVGTCRISGSATEKLPKLCTKFGTIQQRQNKLETHRELPPLNTGNSRRGEA